MAKTQKQKLGARGEALAALFLVDLGYEIVKKNFAIRQGEIDIVAWHEKAYFGKTLCFIEVKTRSYGLGSAERATGRGKLRRVQKAAKAYCIDKHIDMDNTPIQFEQVSVYIKKEDEVTYKHDVIPLN